MEKKKFINGVYKNDGENDSETKPPVTFAQSCQFGE